MNTPTCSQVSSRCTALFLSFPNRVLPNYDLEALSEGKTEAKGRIGSSHITPGPGLPIMTDHIQNELTMTFGGPLGLLIQAPVPVWLDKHTLEFFITICMIDGAIKTAKGRERDKIMER